MTEKLNAGAARRRIPRETKPGWELHSNLFEIHWVKNHRGKLYADKVRINGCTFYAFVHGDVPQRSK
jgi:hypothetical protein